MNSLTDIELGWLVGILEGEGNFSYSGTERVRIEMTDEDIVFKIASLFARVTGSIPQVAAKDARSERQQNTFCVQISGAKARKIMRLVVVHMGFRRRKRIWQCLNKYTEPKSTISKAEILQLVKTSKEQVA